MRHGPREVTSIKRMTVLFSKLKTTPRALFFVYKIFVSIFTHERHGETNCMCREEGIAPA